MKRALMLMLCVIASSCAGHLDVLSYSKIDETISQIRVSRFHFEPDGCLHFTVEYGGRYQGYSRACGLTSIRFDIK